MRALIAVTLVAAFAPAVAHADDTFEDKANGAERVRKVEDVVWAFTATCDQGDDTQNRQCKKLRDTRAAALANATLLVDADPTAFKVGEYSTAKKSLPLTLDSCIRCSGVEVDGKTWFVVGSKEGNPAPTWQGKTLETALLHNNARPFSDAAAAKTYAGVAAKSSVQLLVKVGPKAKQAIAAKNVFVLDVIGYRVFTTCEGAMVCSSPHSGPAEVDSATKKACGTVTSGTTTSPQASGEVLDSLSPALISQTMKPVADQATQCGPRHNVHGSGKVKLTVAADGSVTSVEQSGAFANTKAGECIEALAKQAAFPRNKREKTVFSYPIKLP